MSADPIDGWDWFEKSPDPGAASHVQDAFVRAFATDAGQQVLAFLRQSTIERRLPPDASSAVLRFVEGQRSLVAQIERLAASTR